MPEEPDWGTLGGFALKEAKRQWRVEIAPTIPIPGLLPLHWLKLAGLLRFSVQADLFFFSC